MKYLLTYTYLPAKTARSRCRCSCVLLVGPAAAAARVWNVRECHRFVDYSPDYHPCSALGFTKAEAEGGR